jgi:hypothetical protein
VLLFVSGYLARFDLLADGADDWTPFNSLPAKHAKWIDKEPGFPEVARPFFFLLHGQGENVVGRDAIQRTFEALDAARNVEWYDAFCQPSRDHYDLNKPACEITSVTAFWNHSVDISTTKSSRTTTSFKPCRLSTAPTAHACGNGLHHRILLSKGEKSSTIHSVISFITRIDFPNNANVERMEGKALNAIFDDLDDTGSSFRLEVQAERSAADE